MPAVSAVKSGNSVHSCCRLVDLDHADRHRPAQAQIETRRRTPRSARKTCTVPMRSLCSATRGGRAAVNSFDDYAKFLPAWRPDRRPRLRELYMRGVRAARTTTTPVLCPALALSRRTAGHDDRRRTRHPLLRYRPCRRHCPDLRARCMALARKPAPSDHHTTSRYRHFMCVQPGAQQQFFFSHRWRGYIAEGFVNIRSPTMPPFASVAWDNTTPANRQCSRHQSCAGIRQWRPDVPERDRLQDMIDPVCDHPIQRGNRKPERHQHCRHVWRPRCSEEDLTTAGRLPDDHGTASVVRRHLGYDRGVGFLKYAHALPEFSDDSWYQAALTIEAISDVTTSLRRRLHWIAGSDRSRLFGLLLLLRPSTPTTMHRLLHARDSGGNYIRSVAVHSGQR